MKPTLTFTAILLMSSAAFAQSVRITGKEVTYTRPKPISESKKNFKINYPQVRAATPALSKRIEAALNYEKIFDFKIKDELDEVQWLEEANYDVGYNARGILSIALWYEGVGAYPDGRTVNLVIDTRTGRRVQAADVFTDPAAVLAMVRISKNREVAKSIAEIRKDKNFDEKNPGRLFRESDKYNILSLKDFKVDAKGVTFIHSYNFAHAFRAMEPAGEFFFSWKQLRPHIKRGGLLAQFVG